MSSVERPRYPDVEVVVESQSTLALVAAVRQGLRRARVEREEIGQFSYQALSQSDPEKRRRICEEWVSIRG